MKDTFMEYLDVYSNQDASQYHFGLFSKPRCAADITEIQEGVLISDGGFDVEIVFQIRFKHLYYPSYLRGREFHHFCEESSKGHVCRHAESLYDLMKFDHIQTVNTPAELDVMAKAERWQDLGNTLLKPRLIKTIGGPYTDRFSAYTALLEHIAGPITVID
jgi:hypothetical protein